ncbi:hypothetical protein N9H39_01710 [Gammaproteobacteria bacterium]|nr:hypothetical protein [Gammaproteobacteria bacterium]
MGTFMIIVVVLYSVLALASEQEIGNCVDLKETPDLYNNCLERVRTPIVGSAPESTPQKESEESCYCDVRKRRQVEQRLRKHKELYNSSP